jgi:hypothetical protein
MSALSLREFWVRVTLAFILILVFCAVIFRVLWWPPADSVHWVAVCVFESMILKFSAGLLGLPPQGSVQAGLKIAHQLLDSRAKHKLGTATQGRHDI